MDKTKKILLIAIILVLSISLLDIIFMKSGLAGNPEQYTQGNFTVENFWITFRNISLLFIGLASIIYYISTKDKSESIAIFGCAFILWYFSGLADIFYFWLQGMSVPQFLPWLNNHITLGIIGNHVVTSTTLYLSSAIGLVISYFVAKFLVKIN